MKRLAFALLLAAGSPAGAASGSDQLAPPVVRKPSTAANAPGTQPSANPATTPRTTPCGGAGASPCAPRPAGQTSEAGYFAALSATGGAGGDPILDKGLMRAMSRLMAANRCNDAVALAMQNRRAELAGRAKQLCKAN